MTRLVSITWATLMASAALTAAAQTPGASPQPIKAPTPIGQAMLVKNTLTALNHATISGNYTVLRDLGSSGFQAKHQAADLAKLFERLRDQKLDLSEVLLHNPLLRETPVVDPTGRVRLVGTCETSSRTIGFDLRFAHERGGWTIDEIGLSLGEPAPRPAPAAQQTARHAVPVRVDRLVRPATATVPVQTPVGQPRRLPTLDGR